MKVDNIPGRLAAIVTAGALGAGGTSILFGDVIFGTADFTQKHFQTITIVIATTTAWMAMTSAFKKRHVIAGLGFLILALAGSGVIGWNSLGRQTEGQMLSADDHDKTVRERGQVEKDLADERETMKKKKKAADDECASGEGTKCRSARATVSVYETSVKGYEARLKVLTVKPADASAEAFGNITNAIGGNGTKAKAMSMLLMPIAITILFEYGFTMALHYVFRPARSSNVRKAHNAPSLPASNLQKAQVAPAPTQLAGVSDGELSALCAQFEQPDGPAVFREATKNSDGPRDGKSGRSGPAGGGQPKKKPDGPAPAGGWSKEKTLQHVLTELALGRTIPSQEALKELSGRPKQTVSDWMREWERTRLIPARTQAGRCKALRSPERLPARA